MRFFENLNEYYAHVLRGDAIDHSLGMTDGDHYSWLCEALSFDEICDLEMGFLMSNFSVRITSLEEFKNVERYFQEMIRQSLIFNMEQAADQCSEEELNRIVAL